MDPERLMSGISLVVDAPSAILADGQADTEVVADADLLGDARSMSNSSVDLGALIILERRTFRGLAATAGGGTAPATGTMARGIGIAILIVRSS